MKIAVIGSGAAGLGAALALSESHDVRLFEKDRRFGGHANTMMVEYDGAEIAVDTGFIVFNRANYPTLSALFEHLGVETQDSDMSFSVSLNGGRLEYACDSLDKVFAQRWRAFDPGFLSAGRDVARFVREAPRALNAEGFGDASLGEWLDARGYGRRFRDEFLLPMGGAIWSAPTREMARFPARAFVQFFVNHGLLSAFRRLIQWRTVAGGSQSYVRKALLKLGPRAQAGVGAEAVRRLGHGRVQVHFDNGSADVFDHVILATHAPQALALLTDADPEERATLGAFSTSPNRAVLHRDAVLMPKRRKVWSSWNTLCETGAETRRQAVTYWMNRLQGIDGDKPLFVSLNPPVEPDPSTVFAEFDYAHPVFDRAAFAAQARMSAIQGRRGVSYAGAWLGWGFHEDGLASGVRAAQSLGARPGWARETGFAVAAE